LIDLTNQEVASLRSQFVTLKTGRGGHRKYRQMAFTEHGAINEADSLRMHFATLKKARGAHREHALLVFTEHGAIMAATVLSSPRAVQMSVYIVRAFMKLRQAFASNAATVRRLETLERSVRSRITAS
jgi:hypothetical protein